MAANNGERERSAYGRVEGRRKEPMWEEAKINFEMEFFEQFSVYRKEHVWQNRLQTIANPNSILKCTGHA